jgi:hypothetical protein
MHTRTEKISGQNHLADLDMSTQTCAGLAAVARRLLLTLDITRANPHARQYICTPRPRVDAGFAIDYPSNLEPDG